MGGPSAPEVWKGGLEDVPYNIGPQFLVQEKLRFVTHNYNARRRSYNVIGTITGSVEPGKGIQKSIFEENRMGDRFP